MDTVHSIFLITGCKDMFKKSLFIMGEIGGNDYNDFLFDKRNIEEVASLVPLVIKQIGSAIMVWTHISNLYAINKKTPYFMDSFLYRG